MAKLFMLLLGAKPSGRHTEQHDVFFGIGESIRDLLPQVTEFWPEAKNGLHLDAWREVTLVNGYSVSVTDKSFFNNGPALFFINLGGYKRGEFEEFHYKMIVAAADKGEAIKAAKQTAFFRHTGFTGANAHIDDKYGVDVDDIYDIRDILPAFVKDKYSIVVTSAGAGAAADIIHLGYFNLDSVDRWAPKEVAPKDREENR